MSGISFRSLTFMLLVAFLVWSSNFKACMGRRGRHWRHSRAASSTLTKKKGKTSHSGSSSSSHHHSSGSKPKPKLKPKPKAPSHNQAPTPSHNKAPTPPHNKTPLPSPVPTPRDDDQDYTYNVLDFGAKGDGSSYDTKDITHGFH